MKINSTKKIILLITMIISSFGAYSQAGSGRAERSRPAYANPNAINWVTDSRQEMILNNGIFQPSWVLEINIENYNNIITTDLGSHNFDGFLLDIKNIPQAVSDYYLYGDGDKNNNSALIRGRISNKEFKEMLQKNLMRRELSITSIKRKKYFGNVIYYYRLVNAKGTKSELYYTRLPSRVYVMSYNKEEVRSWISSNWLNKINAIKKGSENNITTLVIDPMLTLKNINKNKVNNTGDYSVKSDIIKLSEEIMVLTKYDEDNLYIGVNILSKNLKGLDESVRALHKELTTKYSEGVLSDFLNRIEISSHNQKLTIKSYILRKNMKNIFQIFQEIMS